MVSTWTRIAIFNAIKADGANADYTKRGIDPLYSVGAGARIVVIGQAPGAVAEETRIPWNDKSGERLRDWLGVSRETFYDPEVPASQEFGQPYNRGARL